jgi:two-component system response regulator YesN
MIKAKILLVDDDELVRRSLELNLKLEGFELSSSAASAEEALVLLKEESYDLLLTDYLMEGMTGIELLKLAKELYPPMKVIVLSGYEGEDSAAEIIRLGANDFLRKPVDIEELLARITAVLE